MMPLRTHNGMDVAPYGAVVSEGAGIVAWIQRTLKRLPSQRTQKRVLRHVETLSLGTKRAVFLIECDGQRFLLADGMSSPVPLTQRFAAEERR